MHGFGMPGVFLFFLFLIYQGEQLARIREQIQMCDQVMKDVRFSIGSLYSIVLYSIVLFNEVIV